MQLFIKDNRPLQRNRLVCSWLVWRYDSLEILATILWVIAGVKLCDVHKSPIGITKHRLNPSLARDLGDRFSFELSIKSCVIRSFLRSNGCHIKLHSKEIIVINIILKIFIAIRKKLIRLSRASASKSLLDILFTAKDYTQFHAVIQFIRVSHEVNNAVICNDSRSVNHP